MSDGIHKAAREIYETFKQKGVQGAAEIAQALFSNSNSYVPYGRGQGTSKDHDQANSQEQGHGVHGKEQPEHERGGREM
jgi:hypothetical protein